MKNVKKLQKPDTPQEQLLQQYVHRKSGHTAPNIKVFNSPGKKEGCLIY